MDILNYGDAKKPFHISYVGTYAFHHCRTEFMFYEHLTEPKHCKLMSHARKHFILLGTPEL